MVEEAQGIGNKRPLIIAGVLALVVVVLYNIHVSRIRSAAEGDTVEVVQYTRLLEPGEELKRNDLEVIEVNRRLAGQLGELIEAQDRPEVVGRELRFEVSKGDLAMWRDLRGAGGDKADPRGLGGLETFTVEVDPNTAPPGLRREDRVHLLGVVQPPGKPAATYRLLYGAPVEDVGDVVRADDERRGGRRYRKITLRLRPEVVPRLSNLLTHMQGEPRVSVVAQVPESQEGTIPAELEPLTRQAAEPDRRGLMGGGGLGPGPGGM